jgi:acyl-CoA synthetase (AMP-forming)/AMP-acid ligase II
MTSADIIARNAAVEIQTTLAPRALLLTCLAVEAELGRMRDTTAEPKGVVLTHSNVVGNLAPIEAEIKKYLKSRNIYNTNASCIPFAF